MVTLNDHNTTLTTDYPSVHGQLNGFGYEYHHGTEYVVATSDSFRLRND